MGFFSSLVNVALAPVRVASSTVGMVADVMDGEALIKSADKAARKVVSPRDGEFMTVDEEGRLSLDVEDLYDD